MGRKLTLYIASFAIAFLFCIHSSYAIDCRVTNPDGVPDNGSTQDTGSLQSLLINPNCTKITFDVSSIKPVTSLLVLRNGVELIGKAGITIEYDTNFQRASGVDYDKCLLRIKGDSGIKISNLTISNPKGEGICILDENGIYPNNNKISNVTITAGTRGIDLGSSELNIIDQSTIIGAGTAATEGVYTTGLVNAITKTKIENFNTGVKVDRSDAASVYISQATFSRMRGKPIDYPSGANGAPAGIRAAFVDGSTFALTGTMGAVVSAFTPNNIEVYTVEKSGSLTTYKYKTTLSSSDFISRDPVQTNLGENEKRFVHVFDIARDQINPTQKMALVATRGVILFFDTSEMSATYDGSNPIVGGSACATENWFWRSYDRSTGTDAYRGWDVDYDGDGILNSCTQANCTDPKMAEDLNKDCVVQANESNPNDWRSRYDFDCDNISDHLVAGKKDNCMNLLKPDGTQYTQATRAVAPACSSYSNQDFKSYNPAQTDTDGDRIGDACETDIDGDTVNDGVDNCPLVANPDQRDSDGDGQGDACQQMPIPPSNATPTDADGDNVSTLRDNCPFTVNSDQKDTDHDGVGDACDPDIDNDGLTNAEETEAGTLPDSPDTDGDGICDGSGMGFDGLCIRPRDNCLLVSNRDQKDQDEDKIGDACDAAPTVYLGDADSDGDGFKDSFDNCPLIKNPSQNDNDHDGLGDPCDSDDDNDGLDDATESGIFDLHLKDDPAHQNRMFADVDGDGYVDGVDLCMNFSNRSENDDYHIRNAIQGPAQTNCGSNTLSNDWDNDGIPNSQDSCSFVQSKNTFDLDGDGKGDVCDLDDDNDDGHENVDTCQDYLVSRHGVQIVAVGASVGRATRTCDYDESAQLGLASWDPDSDHKDGDIFQAGDGYCDGAGNGYGSVGGPNSCIPSDVCPLFYNPTQQGCAPPTFTPGNSPVPPLPITDPSPETQPATQPIPPSSAIQGGQGCSLVPSGHVDLMSFGMLFTGFGILLHLRRKQSFVKVV